MQFSPYCQLLYAMPTHNSMQLAVSLLAWQAVIKESSDGMVELLSEQSDGDIS